MWGLLVNFLSLLDGKFAGEDQLAEGLTGDVILQVTAHGLVESFR